MLLIRRWQLSRDHESRLKWTVDLSLPIRIIAFGVYIIAAMRLEHNPLTIETLYISDKSSLSLLSIKSPSSPAPDLVIASGSYFDHLFSTKF